MIVCVCRRVSDRAISAAVASGARSMEDIAAATGAGTDCGRCREAIAVASAERPCASPPCPGCPRAKAAA
jgi:bacterioferritin-associated ferredoxin